MADQILRDLPKFLPEMALTVTLLAAIIVDLVSHRSAFASSITALSGLLVTGALVVGQWGIHTSIFSNMLAVDPFALFFKLVILLSAVVVVLFSMQSEELNARRRPMGEYYAIILGLTLGLVLMAGANNLLMMYISLELSSLSSYILAGYTREAPDSSEASLKYVIYGAFSSGLMLYGISILYGLTGSLDLATINQVLPVVVAHGGSAVFALIIAGVLALAGFGYKISAVPFHFWTPDVYEGAPITVTALLSVASKAGGFAMLIRFLKVTFADPATFVASTGAWSILQGFDWRLIIAILSVLTMTVGNVVAIWQNNLKRLLAYSSIAHAGYLLMGVVVMNNAGLAAIMLYFAVYLFMNLGGFFVVMVIAEKIGSEDIEDYKGLGLRAPLFAVCLGIFMVSLTGLPPTAGFIGKLYLFAALINSGWIWLAIVGAINSVVALYYYARVLKFIFIDTAEQTTPIRFGLLQKTVMLALVIPILLLGLYFTPLANLAQASVRIFGTP